MTSPLKALVVEDEWPARNYLVELLQATGRVAVVGAVGDLDEAHAALRLAEPLGGIDVAFVDVELAGVGRRAGLDLIRSLASRPAAPMFVLATAFREHAIEAFDLGVVDYLVKPFSEDRVEECVSRLEARRPSITADEPRGPTRIVARRKRTLVFLPLDDVWAFEASERLTFVHSVEGALDLDLSLAAIEGSFGSTFLRVHRNWLVHTAHVREMGRDGSETTLFVGTGRGDERKGVSVPVARERAQSVRETLLAQAAGLKRT
jgi:two-component system, LytTR family, response regulator LytT